MDFGTLRSLAVRLRQSLRKEGIRVDGVILFGSRARGDFTEQSDYDLAILSRDFGRDRFREGVLVNIHANRLCSDFEAIPLVLRDWFDPYPISPIVQEIQRDGVFLI